MEDPLLTFYAPWLASLFVWREAKSESLEARRGILHVVLNRVNNQHRWPHTLAGVLLQKNQFPTNNRNDPSCTRFPLQEDPRGWRSYVECTKLVMNPGPDPTGGATSYESLPDNSPREPWMRPEAITFRSGRFRFYKLPEEEP
jgi:hypothetical protein